MFDVKFSETQDDVTNRLWMEIISENFSSKKLNFNDLKNCIFINLVVILMKNKVFKDSKVINAKITIEERS